MAHSQGGPPKGAHSQFKDGLRQELHSKVTATVKVRAGPSWDERMDKAIKKFQTQSRAQESEMKKNLSEAIEKGRSRPTSCPIRSASEAPDQTAMLLQRKKKMQELQNDYREQLDKLRDKMEKREPLFRLSDVSNAFQMQRERAAQRKREMIQDEHERWEHLRAVENAAASRPLLVDGISKQPPKKSESTPNITGEGGETMRSFMGEREEYEKDIKIKQAVNSPSFLNSEWGKQVKAIKERADNRQKLHEISYPNKGDRHALTRNRLMHTLPAQVPGVY